MRTRTVGKSLYKSYLKKSNECLEASNDSLLRQNWNSAVINAVHCGISACDALTVFFKGERHAGEKHEDVIKLLQGIEGMEKEIINKKTKQLQRLLHLKNSAEYEEKLMGQSDAENAERLMLWAKEKLPAS